MKNVFPDLFNKDQKGEIMIWRIHTNSDSSGHYWQITRGRLGGSNTSYIRYVAAKNVGRSNETTEEQQAHLEALSRWKAKREREGYYSVEDMGFKPSGNLYTDGTDFFTLTEILQHYLPVNGITVDDYSLPMKAQPFWKELKRGRVPVVNFPALAQPKFNGVRCTLSFVDGKPKLMSKKGTEYTAPDHILEEIGRYGMMFTGQFMDNLVLDGELYCHGMHLNDIVSAVRVKSLLTTQIKFYNFDLAVPGYTQLERLRMMREFYQICYNIKTLVHVESKRVNNVDEAMAFASQMIEQGYEGAIIREPNAYYQFGKRVSSMGKIKFSQDEEFEIIDVVDTPGAPGLAVFVCRNDVNDEEFRVNPEGTHEQKRTWFADKANIIGKMLTVVFPERSAAKQVPIQCVGKIIRDYE